MEVQQVKQISDKLNKYDYLAKDSDIIQVTEWSNGEGYDIAINDSIYSFTLGQLEAIDYLIKFLNYN
jgi:hypothetical protein